jgi:phosphoribosylglycinamide formyltransferase-1
MHTSANRGDGGPFRLVVLASGNGSNLQAILDRLHGRDGIEIVGVASDKAGARALDRAREAGVPTGTFPLGDFPEREARDLALADWIEEQDAELVVLAGFMALLTPPFVARFRNRIVNVHPSLLPLFPGLDAIGQALEAGAPETGVTVHFVDEGTDTGPVIVQRPVPIRPGVKREELEREIHAIEHQIFPEAIGMVARGEVRIADDDPGRVIIERGG